MPGLLLVMNDIPADLDEEFNLWYHEEHIAERLALPNLMSARRYRAVGSQPAYMVIYKCETIRALTSPSYRTVLDNPTERTRNILPQMQNVIRATISQTPDHGAEIVRVILEDKELRAEWEAELTEMRERMRRLRVKLAEAIRERSNSTDFDFVAEHSGMFSLLGLRTDVVQELKTRDGVYMINDSRINVAGIPEDRIGELADYLLAATR